MAYRGDTTDPLEIIIARQRMTRRIFLLAMVLMVLPYLSTFDLSSLPTALGLPGQQNSVSRTGQPPATAGAARPPAMRAADVEQWLRTAPASNPAPSDVRCRRDHAWDYICTYRAGAGAGFRSQYQMRVRVNAERVVAATEPYPITARLPRP